LETHEFDIQIRPDGQVKIHMKGIKGAVCMEYAKFFEEIIGKAQEVTHTSEYYEPPSGVQIKISQKTEEEK